MVAPQLDFKKGDSVDSEKNDSFPPTYIVIEFSKNIRIETSQWIVDKITKERRRGGGELLMRRQPPSTCRRLTIHVSADTQQLLELAEEMDIRKRDKYGVFREFMVDQLEDFIEPAYSGELLTTAEKQTLVRHELENIRALSHEICILGHPEYPLYEGQSIGPQECLIIQTFKPLYYDFVSACLYRGVIKQMYPLHDPDAVKKLGTSWYARFLEQQPYEQIRLYFGESIALYFQFLGFYTRSLVLPVALGFLQLLMPSKYLAVFCLLNIICASLFLELWRRKCSELAYTWGTISMTSFDEPRPNFRGVMGIDSVTGKLQPQASRFVTHMKMYFVSLPLVVLCMFGAFMVMLTSFWVDEYIQKSVKKLPFWWFVYLPSTVYAVFIQLINIIYRKFANFLTEWENHRTQSQFDRHRVTKLVLFEFVNNFMSLFYIAFYQRDIALLRYQLALLLIVLQVINNFVEAVMPMLLLRFKKSKKHKKPGIEDIGSVDLIGVKDLDPEDSRISQAVNEGKMDVYDDPYDDYLELFVQFGYVFLFSAVYPMAAFWAFLNNFVEIRSDAFKLCRILQRPVPRKVKDTGAWQRSFQALCALSIMTNCALLGISSDLKESLAPDLGATKWLIAVVLFEHCLHGLRQILHYAIPDKPEWVRVALAKGNYKAKQALKLQRARKNRHKKLSEPML